MRAKKNTIILNGRVYDATTGKAVDGMITPQKSVSRQLASTDSHKIEVKVRSSKPKVERKTTAHNNTRSTEKSKTLMRHVVKRPAKKISQHAVAAPLDQDKKVIKSSTRIIVKSHSASQAKANSILRSPAISKFGKSSAATSEHRVKKAHLPVVNAPSGKQTHNLYDISSTPPTPKVHRNSSKTLKEVHKDLFQTALENANSHKNSYKSKSKREKSPKRRFLRIGGVALTVVALAVFYTYRNIPNLALKKATNKIGFAAHLPDYSPSGYRLSGPIEYSKGKVKINFRSNSNDTGYTLSQVTVGNNSLSNFLNGKDFEKFSTSDFSGYIYGKSNITWLKDGVWYNLTSNASLSQEQLINIASSTL